MNFRKKPSVLLPLDGRKPQNVSEWLEVATWNLVPSAQARIRAEIEAHYHEAVQSHLASGAPEAMAEIAALTDLGDAHAAAKRFGKQYLTTREANVVLKRIKTARAKGTMFSALLVTWIAAVVVSLIYLIHWAFAPAAGGRYLFFALAILLLVLTSIFLSKAADVLARRKSTLVMARQIFMLGAIRMLNAQILVITINIALLMTTAQDSSPDLFYDNLILRVGCGMATLGALVVIASQSQAEIRLCKKLSVASEDDLPPPDSSIA